MKRRDRRAAATPYPNIKMLRRLSAEQNHRCCYCGVRTHFPKNRGQPEPDGATIEHVQPLGRGGSNEWENLAMACAACNAKRKSFDPYWFSEQQFWKPENATALRLVKMQEAFMRSHQIGTLVAMAAFCQCREPQLD